MRTSNISQFQTKQGATTQNIAAGTPTGSGPFTYTLNSVILSHPTGTTVAAIDAAGNISSTFSFTAPAGIAGTPINLALADPSAGQGDTVTFTVDGVPQGWSLNAGTDLGNGTWSGQTSDLSSLTVTTTASFAGATVLHVTESWTNADGSTGSASIADNVEAYASGSPIFAWSGDDTLTGSGANDEFVFSQPIGNDIITTSIAASDQIDLIGFITLPTSPTIQANLADDGNGNAVITIGDRRDRSRWLVSTRRRSPRTTSCSIKRRSQRTPAPW